MIGMIELWDADKLLRYEKKSFALPYNGGEIWFEHLDGLYGNENLVLRKLASDVRLFTKPSSTSYICFVFDETLITERILISVIASILESKKRFMKVAFSGLDKRSRHKLKRELLGEGFAIGFFHGLEEAKEWLVP